ncbi:penicillin-binding protein 2 [Flavobacteriaceae bacterium]|jgi:cell division protein FtsI (penicillin-binding protein 3)|nr:penicillin-binding protein 2 [Flavobacteriaceae bacterium]MDA8938337.1 penicillin-binding protein 2 [Flavobacteriaceae bacterium]MDC0116674.1 penicillin-binding protein 2 [Flavobacteriaceae bacterium]|tara:strand:- start:259 stop:2220 length:1962 start_codon:yes stop_codon:yes gene_type:complete
METNQKQFLYRLYLVAGILVFLGFGIGYKIFHIQYVDGDNYRQLAKNKTIQNFTISPERGNIFSDDGSLLAASTTSFDIYFDAVTVSDNNFSKYSNQLSEKLSESLNKSKEFFLKRLVSAKKNNKRYQLIQRGVSIENLNKIKQMPLFRMGGVRGGLIIEKKNSRDYPLNKIAERTIGYERLTKDDNFSGVGLEHAFGSKLRGKNGMQLMQKISNGKWKPISSNNKIEPIPGTDIISTINIGFQDITHHSLLKQLEDFEADHGTAVVMETATGEIKAIANLGRTSEGKYYERLNYAVGEHLEPGSTFKLMSIIAALEDGKVDLNTIIDTKNGVLDFYGSKVRDSKKGGYGKISVNEVFKVSSNTGIVKIINDAYKDDPKMFSNRLYNMGLNNKLGVSILGESNPKIPHPNDKDWNGLSLPWMVYGYGVLLSPLQILTFYNSVANNGEMVKPVFTRQSNSMSNKTILNPSICSDDTLEKVKLMLENVVNEKGGTGYNIKSNIYKIAGKTGTGQVDYNTDNMQYISSFVGYFPANKPKYSCIVVIHKPNKKKGYYGATVAAPVFKKIADKIYSLTPELVNYNKIEKLNSSQIYSKVVSPLIDVGNLSIIKGKNYKNILPALENLGLDVSFIGTGLVIKNFRFKNKSQKKIVISLI